MKHVLFGRRKCALRSVHVYRKKYLAFRINNAYSVCILVGVLFKEQRVLVNQHADGYSEQRIEILNSGCIF